MICKRSFVILERMLTVSQNMLWGLFIFILGVGKQSGFYFQKQNVLLDLSSDTFDVWTFILTVGDWVTVMNPNSWDQTVSEGEKHGARFEVYTRLLVCYATLFYHFFHIPMWEPLMILQWLSFLHRLVLSYPTIRSTIETTPPNLPFADFCWVSGFCAKPCNCATASCHKSCNIDLRCFEA